MADRSEPVLADDTVPAGGVDLRPAPWRVPDCITAEMMADCRVEVQRLEPMLEAATPESVRRWLIMLGNLVARQPGETQDGENRLNALCLMFDDEPAGVFTKASLKRAAARFTFFPSAAELADFLGQEAAGLRKRAQRLMMILDTGARRRPERGDPQDKDFRWSKEEAEDHSRRLYEVKARERREILEALGLDPIPVPPRGRGESDRDYGIRLARHASALCKATTDELASRSRTAPVRPKPAEEPCA